MGHGSLYLQRYSYGARLIESPPPPDLKISVVIPCHAEPDIISTLQSLADCEAIDGSAEVIIVVNQSSTDPPHILDQNIKTLNQVAEWNATNQSDLNFHLLHQTLPAKHAGVGLARKIGMDEAYRRFDDLDHNGIMVCLDADCTCKANYLKAIQHHFATHASTPGCTIYFEHPLEGPMSEAIAAYELHLRYYTHALRYCKLPCAYQTVGSAMAVRSNAYAKQGGMNKRKAGEDFYFLQKIIKLGGFTELNSTVVYPSARLSSRVPFGTGKAMSQYQNTGANQITTYHPDTFNDLKRLVQNLPALHRAPKPQLLTIWESFSTAVQGFIPKETFLPLITDFNQNTNSYQSFEKRFFQWCDGFLAFKFSNYARTHHYQAVKVADAARWLLKVAYELESTDNDVTELLMQYRFLDKQIKN